MLCKWTLPSVWLVLVFVGRARARGVNLASVVLKSRDCCTADKDEILFGLDFSDKRVPAGKQANRIASVRAAWLMNSKSALVNEFIMKQLQRIVTHLVKLLLMTMTCRKTSQHRTTIQPLSGPRSPCANESFNRDFAGWSKSFCICLLHPIHLASQSHCAR